MMTLPFPKMPTLVNTLLAVLGLAAVVALSVPDLTEGMRLTLETALVVIWGIYVLQLLATVLARPAGQLKSEGAAVAVDLLAVIVPLAFLLVGTGTRDQSLFCSIWILKPLRDSTFFRLMGKVLANEARNLIGVMSVFGIVLFVAALAGYLLERDAQPDKFGSIPHAMWWAVVTLTTTGYGGEIPQSLAGRVLAGVVMMSGIGVFALWAGILATGFAEEIRRQDFVRKWQLVSTVPLFHGLGPAELVGIVGALRPRNLSAGAVICRKGETGDQMFFIVEGHVSVAAASPVELGPGTFFGEMALVTGEPRSATVVASSAVSLLSLHSLDFQILSSRNPEIAEIIRQTALERRGAKPKS